MEVAREAQELREDGVEVRQESGTREARVLAQGDRRRSLLVHHARTDAEVAQLEVVLVVIVAVFVLAAGERGWEGPRTRAESTDCRRSRRCVFQVCCFCEMSPALDADSGT